MKQAGSRIPPKKGWRLLFSLQALGNTGMKTAVGEFKPWICPSKMTRESHKTPHKVERELSAPEGKGPACPVRIPIEGKKDPTMERICGVRGDRGKGPWGLKKRRATIANPKTQWGTNTQQTE